MRRWASNGDINVGLGYPQCVRCDDPDCQNCGVARHYDLWIWNNKGAWSSDDPGWRSSESPGAPHGPIKRYRIEDMEA